MSKFPIGVTVQYAGAPELKEFFGETKFKVVDVIPHGMPIGNGEYNNSEQNIYRCQDKEGNMMYNFLESEIEIPD